MKRMLIVCLIAVAILAIASMTVPGAEAATKTWTGATNSAWAQSNNWYPAGVPNSSHEVYIPDVSTDPVISTDASAYSLQLNDSSELKVDGGTLSVRYNTRVNSTATLDLMNNATVYNSGSLLQVYGLLNCSGHSPEIFISGSMYVYSSFEAGTSTVTFNGTGSRNIYSPGNSLNDLVLNNTGLRLIATGSSLSVTNNLTVWNGTFVIGNRSVRVGNDFHCHDELEMTFVNDLLDVSGDVLFYNGSSTDVTEGEIQCGDEWYVFDGADMQLGGDNMVVFNDGATGYESIEFYDADSYFHNVTISKSSNSIELITTHPINITGDLVVDHAASGQEFDVWNGELNVSGDVRVTRGMFVIWGSGSAVSIGDMFVSSAGSMQMQGLGDLEVWSNLTVEGTVSFNSASGGSIFVDGYTYVQNGGRIAYSSGYGEFIAGDDVYINSTCTLAMTSGDAYFNMSVGKYFHVYDKVDLRNDDAHLNVGHMWMISGSSSVNCGGYSPEITVLNAWYNIGTFTEGNSTVSFIGSFTGIYYPEVFWNVIIDMSWRLFIYENITVNGTLLILNGDLEFEENTLIVNGNDQITHNMVNYRGFINIGGDVIMDEKMDKLEVFSDILWGSTSIASIDNGTINCTGNWSFESGSNINLTGRNIVNLNGSIPLIGSGDRHRYIWSNSSSSSFNDLYVNAWGNPFGDEYYTYVESTETLVVDGDLEKSGRFGYLFPGPANVTVWGNVNITQGPIWHDGIGHLDVHGDLFTYDDSGMFPHDGGLYLGHNVSWTGGGEVRVRGRIMITGNLWFQGPGGNLTVDEYITVGSAGELVFYGGSGNITTGTIYKEVGGVFAIYSNDTTIDVVDLIINSSMRVGGQKTPTFLISDDLEWANVLWVDMGHSEVRLDGTGNQTLDSAIEYWGVVIDKPSGEANFDGNAFVECYFAIHRGGFDLWGRVLTIPGNGTTNDGYDRGTLYRGFLVEDAVFNMTNANGKLMATMVYLFFGSNGTLTAGEIHVRYYFYVQGGSRINMTGTSTWFDQDTSGHLYIYSTDFSFSDVTVAKPTFYSMTFGTVWTAPIVVKGDLTIDNTGYDDVVNVRGDLFVTGDVIVIEGVLYFYDESETIIKGDMYVTGDGTCKLGHWNGGGNVEIRGFLSLIGYGMHFNYTGGNVTVGGTTWIDSILGFGAENGNVTTFSTEEIRVNATGTLYVGSNETIITTELDVTYTGDIRIHDLANPRFIVHDDWNANGGTFQSGMSEVWLEGTGLQYLDLERYWIVVINKTSGTSYCTNDGLTVKSCLFIMDGVFNTWGFTTYVNSSSPGFLYNGTYYTGFVNYGGILSMTSSDDVLDVNGPVVWGPDSTDDIQDGEFYCNGSWTFMAGSEATMDNITVEFDGNNGDIFGWSWAGIYSNSTESYFADIIIDRDMGYGMAVEWSSTVPLQINGDVTTSNFAIVHAEVNVTGYFEQTSGQIYVDAEFGAVYGDAILSIGRDLYVQSGASFFLWGEYANVTVECEDIIVNGTLTVMYQGWLNVSGQSTVYGTMAIDGRGSWNTNGGSLTIASGSVVTMSNYPFTINASLSVLLQGSTTTRLYSDSGSLNAGAYMVVLGTLDCAGYSPEIHVGADWSSSASATFTPGYSTVFFEGTGVDTTIDHTKRFYDVVVDISARTLTLETDVSCYDLNLTSGTIELDTYNLTVRHDLDSTDTLNMDGDVWLNVSHDVNWNAGSDVTITSGTCVVSGDLTIENATDVTYAPSSLLRFNGSSQAYLRNYDPGTSLGDVQVNKSYSLYIYGSSLPLYMGNLSINAKGTSFGVNMQSSRVVVAGDLDIVRGKLYIHLNGNVTVNGTLTSSHGSFIVLEWGDIVAQTLIVDGTLFFNGSASDVWVNGSAYIPGSEIIFNVGSTSMYVGGDLWINNTGVVNMTGAFVCTLEVNGKLKIYGLLNMTNDWATLICHDDLEIWPTGGGTLYVGGTSEPDIHLYRSFNGLGPASNFIPGHSVFHLVGPNYQSLEDGFDYWGIVIDKNGSYARFEGNTGATAHVRSFLFMNQGTFNMMDASVMVNSSGSGYMVWPTAYTGFTNYGGYLTMTNENGTLDVNGPVYWGSTATEYVNDGEIFVSGSWTIESGALMTLTGKNHVHFDGDGSAMYYGNASGAQFRNVTVEKDPTHALVFAGGLMNVTNTLTIDSTDGIDVSDYRLEAFGIVHDDGELNVSGSSGEVYVWDTLAMGSTATLWMADGSYAYITDFTGMGTIWLGNGTNLTVEEDLFMSSGTLHPGRSTVYFTGWTATSISIGGSFHDLVADKGGLVQVALYKDLYVEGDLRILMATFYPQSNEIQLGGDYYCSPSARFAQPASPGMFTFNGGTDQYVRTGGTNTYHAIQNITVTGSGTTVHVVDDSLNILHTLIVEYDTEFSFVADNETFYTGSGGIMNNGTFRVVSDHGPIDVEIYAGSDVVNNGLMYFVDASWTRSLHLRSSSAGTQWNLIDNTPTKATPYVFHVNVSDSDASGNNTIYAGTGYNHDDGNNDNWVFSHRVNLWYHDLEGHEVNVTVYHYGDAVVINRSSGVWDWSDENSTVTLEDEYIVTSNEERYYTEDTTQWTVTSEVDADVYFYRQWKPTITLDGTDISHTVTAYFTTLAGTTSQSNQHTSWSRWTDNGTALSFDKEASGAPVRHTSEDFTAAPWDPLTSALVRTVYYSGNDIPELYNGSMDPSGGNMTTMFNFTVEYWDADNDTPQFVYVNIDGTNHTMDKVDGGDGDYTDGCEYYYETLLSGGDHDYYFICNDTYVTNQTSVENTGTIIPEFGLLPVMFSVMALGVAVLWRRKKRL